MQNTTATREKLPEIQRLVDFINSTTSQQNKKVISDFLVQEGYPPYTEEIPLNKYIKYLVYYSDRMQPYHEQISILVDNLRHDGYDVKIFMQDYTLTLYGLIEENKEG